jgi:hypothetical protein
MIWIASFLSILVFFMYIRSKKDVVITPQRTPPVAMTAEHTLDEKHYNKFACTLPIVLGIVTCTLPLTYEVSLLANTCKEAYFLMHHKLQQEKVETLSRMKIVSSEIQSKLMQSLPHVTYDIFRSYDPKWFPMLFFNDVYLTIYVGNKSSVAILATIDKKSPTVTIAMQATEHKSPKQFLIGKKVIIKLNVTKMGKNRYLTNSTETLIQKNVQWMDARFTLAYKHCSDGSWNTDAEDTEWTKTFRVLETKIHSIMDECINLTNTDLCKQVAEH